MVRANTTFFTSDEIEQERVVYNHDDSVHNLFILQDFAILFIYVQGVPLIC